MPVDGNGEFALQILVVVYDVPTAFRTASYRVKRSPAYLDISA
jgi:hypothetical protein